MLKVLEVLRKAERPLFSVEITRRSGCKGIVVRKALQRLVHKGMVETRRRARPSAFPWAMMKRTRVFLLKEEFL